MTVTEEEHEKWHKEHSEITPEQHEALMKKMGISKEEDEEWHKRHGISQKNPKKTGTKTHQSLCYWWRFFRLLRQTRMVDSGR